MTKLVNENRPLPFGGLSEANDFQKNAEQSYAINAEFSGAADLSDAPLATPEVAAVGIDCRRTASEANQIERMYPQLEFKTGTTDAERRFSSGFHQLE